MGKIPQTVFFSVIVGTARGVCCALYPSRLYTCNHRKGGPHGLYEIHTIY